VTAAEGGAEEEVGEYVEPPEEAKVYVGNLPYDVDGEGLAQLFEQAGIVEVAEVSVHSFSYPSASYGN
jgi:nucleolin